MNHFFLLGWLSFSAVACHAQEATQAQPGHFASAARGDREDCVVLPSRTNAIQLRLYTNASPDSPRLFNTFELEAFGEKLLRSPGVESLRQSLAATPTNASLHNLLVNGLGPELSTTNSMELLEQASGPDWSYIAFDVTPAYCSSVAQYRRGILYVAPDLFVVHDHFVGRELINVQMLLHPPAATRVDPDWHDLRLATPGAGLRVNAPSRRELRSWERINSPADALLPDTITVQIGPTNQVTQLDLLTVFAVQPGGKGMDYVFKLVESNTAVGARIHRDGLPTLVAFRLDPANPNCSLDSFKFSGPVGVSVFRPKRNAR